MKIKLLCDGGYSQMGSICDLVVDADKVEHDHTYLFKYSYKVHVNEFKKLNIDTRYYDWLEHLVFHKSEVEEL